VVLLSSWGDALAQRARLARLSAPVSNGQRAARRFGLRSAGDEAAQAFPVLFDVTLPALQAALQAGAGDRAARVQALFATMAELDDTNCVHRGGIDGLRFVQASASQFLQAGGVLQTGWLQHARAIHAAFVARRLSPGGSADVLASACWVASLITVDLEAAPSLRGSLATRQSRLHGLLHCVRNDKRGSSKAPPELAA
jgi:triphosphoribosyl-dephospho-CoA synthase